MKRVGWVFLLLLFAPALHAFEVTIPGSFTISGLTRSAGKLEFPAERKQYHNIRILDRATHDFLVSCPVPCIQPLTDVTPAVVEVRPAQTRKNMWIVQVAFNQAWLITFLVFQKGNNLDVKLPDHFTFNSDALAAQTRQIVVQAVRENV